MCARPIYSRETREGAKRNARFSYFMAQCFSLAKKMDPPSPPMGSPTSPDCKWYYKSVGAASYERGFCRARRCSSILRRCSLRWLTRRKELLSRFKRPPRGVATRCKYRSGILCACAYVHVFIYTGCPRLDESAVNSRFLRSFGNENLNTKMLRKM